MRGGRIAKRQEDTFEGTRDILYVTSVGGFMGKYTYQNSWDRVLSVDAVLY